MWTWTTLYLRIWCTGSGCCMQNRRNLLTQVAESGRPQLLKVARIFEIANVRQLNVLQISVHSKNYETQAFFRGEEGWTDIDDEFPCSHKVLCSALYRKDGDFWRYANRRKREGASPKKQITQSCTFLGPVTLQWEFWFGCPLIHTESTCLVFMRAKKLLRYLLQTKAQLSEQGRTNAHEKFVEDHKTDVPSSWK